MPALGVNPARISVVYSTALMPRKMRPPRIVRTRCVRSRAVWPRSAATKAWTTVKLDVSSTTVLTAASVTLRWCEASAHPVPPSRKTM
jgi:hypothetical protein